MTRNLGPPEDNGGGPLGPASAELVVTQPLITMITASRSSSGRGTASMALPRRREGEKSPERR